ncbi:FGGY-family carbohydrate kinase [Streptomyces sp. NBC_00237]|uniref:xylulokinase n=1 Tax=Streptomyces sp. NBC_00237 TaxID=2975687 RepID=UPI0022585868|nr:FGGY-family carbohydrate kinase [Streptomyces sp. NBC_00237]MCX5206263.1 FGGY-family carbohydrate kinase [Streptomyces sp. NBC_00237]
MAALVAGVDSSTQSCKVVVRDAVTGAPVRSGSARHPEGTEVHPDAWWDALRAAIAAAGGIDDVVAVSVGGQQHGMVCLDEDGAVVRPALLWNDTRSAGAATSLVREAGGGDAAVGARWWAEATGTLPVASVTSAKLRWLADNEPRNAARTAAVCLPHDWLSWRLAGHGPGSGGLDALWTDRSDASGTGYWSPSTGEYLPEVLVRTLGHLPVLPRVLGPLEAGNRTPGGALLGPGAGDNAAAGLGVGASVGDVVVSIGTSGTVFAVADRPTADPSGHVAGFADATGHYLPLVCTLNASRVLDATAALLDVSLDGLTSLALSAPTGAGGLTLVPYFQGERTPNLPDATGSLHGMTLRNFTPAHLARAAVEGIVCSLADGLAALTARGVPAERIILVGGGARSTAVQEAAASVFGLPVLVPEPGEYVAEGAARQAAGVYLGHFPAWRRAGTRTVTARPAPDVLDRYRAAR